jgi:integrase
MSLTHIKGYIPGTPFPNYWREYASLIKEVNVKVVEEKSKDIFGKENIARSYIYSISKMKNVIKVNGIYCFRKLIDGKRKFISLDTKDPEAALIKVNALFEKFFNKKVNDIFDDVGNRSSIKPSSVELPVGSNRYEDNSIEALYKIYVLTKKSVHEIDSKETEKKKVSIMNKLLKFNVRRLSDINNDVLNKIYNSYGSFNAKLTFCKEIKAYLRYLIKKGLYNQQQFDQLEFVSGSFVPKIGIIDQSTLTKIFDYMKENDFDFYTYMMLLLYTISRPKEVLYIKNGDIDYSRNEIIIYTDKTRRYNKDKKIIPIFPELKDTLISYISYKKEKADPYILDGAYSRSDEYYSKKFKRIKKDLKIDKKITLYTFRHTSITYLLWKTKDIKLVSEMANIDSNTLLKTYANYDNTFLHKGIEGVVLR